MHITHPTIAIHITEKESENMTTDTIETNTDAVETPELPEGISLDTHVLKSDVIAMTEKITNLYDWCEDGFKALIQMGIKNVIKPSELPVGAVVGTRSPSRSTYVKVAVDKWEATDFGAFSTHGRPTKDGYNLREAVTDAQVAENIFFVIFRPDGNYTPEVPKVLTAEDYVRKSLVRSVATRVARGYSYPQQEITEESLITLGIPPVKPRTAEEYAVGTVAGLLYRYTTRIYVKVEDNRWEMTNNEAFDGQGRGSGGGELRKNHTNSDLDNFAFFVVYTPDGTYAD